MCIFHKNSIIVGKILFYGPQPVKTKSSMPLPQPSINTIQKLKQNTYLSILNNNNNHREEYISIQTQLKTIFQKLMNNCFLFFSSTTITNSITMATKQTLRHYHVSVNNVSKQVYTALQFTSVSKCSLLVYRVV